MNKRLGLLLGLLVTCSALAAEHGVKEVSPDRFHLEAGDLSLGLSQDWRKPLPQVTRALVIVHGRLRNAQTYLQSAEDAAAHAGQAANTLVIAPQFLNASDVKRNHLDNQVLRWKGNDWMAGAPSTAPGQISAYGALDQIIKHLGNRTLFPALKEIVVAGHSGGGQVVQRFALTGHDHPTLRTEGIRLRYVVANPSSYPTSPHSARCSSTRPVAQASTTGNMACNTCRPTPRARAPSSLSTPMCHATSPTCWASKTPTRTTRHWTKAAPLKPRARIA
jgi:pimeloyl-ACP methyl ester carboxylesterase